MKTKITTSLFVLLCLVAMSFAQTVPNYVTTKSYLSNSPDTFSTTTEYSDGLGRVVQTRSDSLNGVGLVVVNLYNQVGRLETVTVPFRVATAGYFFGDAATVLSTVNGQRGEEPLAKDGANNKACYSTYTYKPDPFGRISKVGAPGALYSSDFGTHYPRTWYIGTALNAQAQSQFVDAQGFLLDGNFVGTDAAVAGVLDEFESVWQAVPSPTHFLTVTKDPQGSYTQVLTDLSGRTLGKCTRTGVGTQKGIRSAYQYDILGNMLFDTLPKDNERGVDGNLKSEYRYNTLGQSVWKNTADAGIVRYKYDPAGRLWFTQDARQAANTYGLSYTVCIYDNLGRQTAVGLNALTSATFDQADGPTGPRTEADISVCVRHIYDDPQGLITYAGLRYDDPLITMGLRNLRGRLVAKIAYDGSGINSPAMPDFKRHVVIEVFTYDDEGRIDTTYTFLPRTDTYSKRAFKYRLQGDPSEIRYYPDYTKTVCTTTKHPIDILGRPAGKKAGGAGGIIEYRYNKYGALEKTVMKKNSDGAKIDSVARQYSLQGWPVIINSARSKYSETFSYAGRFDGNIVGIMHSQLLANGTTTYSENHTYTYDNLSRLEKAAVVVTGASGVNYNEEFTYLADGSLNSKKKGTETTWNYIPKMSGANRTSHRLDYIQNAPGRDVANNYLYDPNGNMILDCSKKMLVVYDWRDMPVSFKFFSTIPAAARTATWNAVESYILSGGGLLTSEVKMVYNADGDRVQKVNFKYTP